MSVLDTLTEGNREFAKTVFSPQLKIVPTLKIIIIGCVDPRVDPNEIFMLKPGDAAVIRNVGGRVFPSTLETMEMLTTVTQAKGGRLGKGWHLIVLHHTDCGINALLPSPKGLANHFGVAPSELPRFAVSDPSASVAVDIATLRSDPRLSPDLEISGLVYDVATGSITKVTTAG